MYGSEVGPKPPQQDMFTIDQIAGAGPHDRRDGQDEFTGAAGPAGELGLGGQAEPPPPGGTLYERIGF